MARWQRWINALVLKTSEPFGSVGSNPTLVAKRKGVDIDILIDLPMSMSMFLFCIIIKPHLKKDEVFKLSNHCK